MDRREHLPVTAELFVEDVRRSIAFTQKPWGSRSCGARIVREIGDRSYGLRDFRVLDPGRSRLGP